MVENEIVLPRRLREARVIRQMSQAELAERLEVTKQAISQYESGRISPKTEIIMKMASVLDFSWAYFYKPYPEEIITPIFFRKRKTSRKKYTEMFQVYINWMIEVYLYLEKFLKLPTVNITYKTGINYTTEEIKDAAIELRRKWGLGNGPISNMTLLLENNGFIVAKTGLSAEKVDACSVYFTSTKYEKRPMVFLTSSTSAVRSRRDAAHELGHQVLHSWMTKEDFDAAGQVIEKEADTFASYFLMPEQAMEREKFAVTSVDSLLIMKKRWGTSALSILYHLHSIGCISDGLFNSLLDKTVKRGWRKREPYDNEIPQEKPELIKDAINLLVENKIKTATEIIEELGFPIKEASELCGVAQDYFVNKVNNKPEMYLIKR